jgi:hypothetical protein
MTRMEIYSGPDRDGKCHFALFWMADYHPGHPQGEHRIAERSQHLRADPAPYMRPGMKIDDRREGRHD